MPVITNISAYLFADLTNLKPLREELAGLCRTHELKGTILLSEEGVNLFVAGARTNVDQLVARLRQVAGLEKLTPKYSESDHQPFSRMLVKIKREIIAFGIPGIVPAKRTSPKLAPTQLKQWLDEGRPITLLDTRNDYEVKLGTFRQAQPIGIQNFREFPQAVLGLPAELKNQPIVMFCTGGIRCEKAGPYMEQQGFQEIYQLDGGILKYFEECGGEHYDGECFVFDQRVGVDPALAESNNTQCFACLTPLTVRDQTDDRYQPPHACPYCYQTPQQQMAERVVEREVALKKIVTPLPGSQPYDNLRPLSVPGAFAGLSLSQYLSRIFRHIPEAEWIAECQLGMILNADHQPVPAETSVRSGDRFFHRIPLTVEPDVNADIRIVYEDDHLLVINKPAPLPMHPCGRFNRNSLQSILGELYAPQTPKPAHRLDAMTTGLVAMARTRHFASQLQPQFTRGEIEKVYLVRVQGHPPDDEFRCAAPITSEPGPSGSRTIAELDGGEDTDAGGLDALTLFRVQARHKDGTALVEARPQTGRTNQIRIHLWHLGWPILGDPLYLPGGRLAQNDTPAVGALTDASLCLHAWKLSFVHPRKNERMSFETPVPEWAAEH